VAHLSADTPAVPVVAAVDVPVDVVVSVEVSVAVVVGAGCWLRIGGLIPDRPDTTLTGCAVSAVGGDTELAATGAGVAEAAGGVLSAGCISTTQPATSAKPASDRSVFIEMLITLASP